MPWHEREGKSGLIHPSLLFLAWGSSFCGPSDHEVLDWSQVTFIASSTGLPASSANPIYYLHLASEPTVVLGKQSLSNSGEALGMACRTVMPIHGSQKQFGLVALTTHGRYEVALPFVCTLQPLVLQLISWMMKEEPSTLPVSHLPKTTLGWVLPRPLPALPCHDLMLCDNSFNCSYFTA